MTLSHRIIATALRQLQKEKEERLTKEAKDEQERLQKKAEEKRRELDEVEKERAGLEQRTKKEAEELERVRQEAAAEEEAADEEARLHKLQARMEEFRGASDDNLRRRLIAEGYGEQLINDFLRRRTLDAKLEREGGLQELIRDRSPSEREDPLARVLTGQANIYDVTNRQFVDRLSGIRDKVESNVYLRQEERDFLYAAGGLVDQFAGNPAYQGKDERGYLSQSADIVESIRRGLGLDAETNTLKYHK